MQRETSQISIERATEIRSDTTAPDVRWRNGFDDQGIRTDVICPASDGPGVVEQLLVRHRTGGVSEDVRANAAKHHDEDRLVALVAQNRADHLVNPDECTIMRAATELIGNLAAGCSAGQIDQISAVRLRRDIRVVQHQLFRGLTS